MRWPVPCWSNGSIVRYNMTEAVSETAAPHTENCLCEVLLGNALTMEWKRAGNQIRFRLFSVFVLHSLSL